MPSTDAGLLASAGNADIRQQNRRIFQIYHAYRLALALILLLTFYYRNPNSPLGSVDRELFITTCLFYLLANLLTLTGSRLGFLQRSTDSATPRNPGITIIILDILILALLSYTCGGVRSGLAHLMLIPVATGSILFGTRLGIFIASVGAIAAIYSEAYLTLSGQSTDNYYVQAGLLGMVLFLCALFLQYLGQRIRQKELINLQQAASIESLQKINQQIIQRMQTGIIVVNAEGTVLISNSSARRLLAEGQEEATLRPLPEPLRERVEQWLDDPENRGRPFSLGHDTPQILASFSRLKTDSGSNILIFIEDYTQLSSRAQHLKLMSLGRLSASIAHEIRNPLGAISHACQLLDESSDISAADKRLLDIINTHTMRVNTIIENILEHSRARQQAVEVFELGPWMQQFISRLMNSYSNAVECEFGMVGEQLRLRFSQSQLEQLLTNLCDNAIRYSTQHSGKAVVQIHAYLNPLNQSPVIDIIDLGPGVPGDRLEQIFEPFYTTETSGTGLGLFICREICEAHQARIFHTRSDDGHSCFRIQFAHPERNIS